MYHKNSNKNGFMQLLPDMTHPHIYTISWDVSNCNSLHYYTVRHQILGTSVPGFQKHSAYRLRNTDTLIITFTAIIISNYKKFG